MKRTVVFLSLALTLVACKPDVTPYPDEPEVPQVPEDLAMPPAPLPETEFLMDATGAYSGTIRATGYGSVEKVKEPFCEQNCKEYDAVYFVVTDGDSTLKQFMRDYQMREQDENQFMIGCLSDAGITYMNDSEEYGMESFTIPEALTENILNATADTPIVLRMTKLPLGGGSDAPACYSHFTRIEGVAG